MAQLNIARSRRRPLTISCWRIAQMCLGFSGAFGPMLLNGLSAGFVFMPATSSVLSGVAPEHAGSASGLLQTFQQLGGAIGLAVIVSVYAAGAEPGQFLPGAPLRRRPVGEPCP